MIALRHFGSDDVSVLQEKRYPDMTCHEIAEMIREWNSCEYDGRYFEMFAVISDGRTVGSISVFENSRSAAEIGPDIFPDERRKGFAYEAMLQAVRYVSDKGYRVLIQQVRYDNTASIRLHEKLGFEQLESVYRNSKGNNVLLYIKILG